MTYSPCENEGYKCIGMLWVDEIMEGGCKRRIRKVLIMKVNGGNVIEVEGGSWLNC